MVPWIGKLATGVMSISSRWHGSNAPGSRKAIRDNHNDERTRRRHGGLLFSSCPLCLCGESHLVPQRRLGRRQPGDGHAERRTAHVIQTNLVAEFDAVGV